MSQTDFFGEDGGGGIRGVAVGIVTDNEDPQGIGRVKLRYPWREIDDDSYWARVVTPMAGNEYGAWFLPEVGDEVLVAFDDGDLSHPYVIGSLWSGNTPPPADNSDGDNDLREIKSRSGHKIDLDDDDSEGRVEIQTSAGHKIVLDDKSGSEKVTIEDKSGSNLIELDSASNEVSIEAGSKISLSASEIELSADSKISASSDGNVEISSNVKLDLSSSTQAKLSSNGSTKIEGAIIQLN